MTIGPPRMPQCFSSRPQVGRRRPLSGAAVLVALAATLLGAVGVAGPAAAAADVSAPQLTGFDFTPRAIDTTTAPATVAFTVHATDDVSGIAAVQVGMKSPSGTRKTARATSPVAGTSVDGDYQLSMGFPAYGEGGTWTVDYVYLVDVANNYRYTYTADLLARPFPTSLAVTSDQDKTAPSLAALTLDPASVDTSASAQTVTASLRVTDDRSGVSHVHVTLRSPSGAQTVDAGSFSPASGTALDGTYSVPLTLPAYGEAGTWKVDRIYLSDVAGNVRNLYTAALDAAGFPTTVTVTSTTDADAPDLTAFDFSPKSIDTTQSGKSVAVTLHATDALSGVASVTVYFTSPSGQQSRNGESAVAINGTTAQDGDYQLTVNFPQNVEGGTWNVEEVYLVDRVGNARSILTGQLASRGFPTQLAVTSGSVPGSPTGASATAGDTSAVVSWTPPADTGGYSITSYTVTSSAGQTVSAGGTATSATVAGLSDGASYTFTVVASNALGASVPSAASNAVRPLPAVAVGDVSLAEGNAGATAAALAVSLSSPSTATVTVDYTTADASASAGSDYASTTGTLTFAPGETTKTISVPVSGDTAYEQDETFSVLLSGPVNATISRGTGTATVRNDDAIPTVAIGDVTVTEGNSGTTPAVFTVTLSAASGLPVTVSYATVDATATSPSDYGSAAGTVTFAPGVTSRTVTVAVNGDTLVEPAETFSVQLSGPTNATISDGTGTATIANDDVGSASTPTLAIGDVTVTEGNAGTTAAVFPVTLSAASPSPVTVRYATAAGTAAAGTDYVSSSGTVTFQPGQTATSITVPVIGDTLNEAAEKFSVSLSSPVNATIADGLGLATITNDDPVPAFAISDVAKAEGNSGTTAFTFTVTLSAPSGRTTRVSFATANGTAIAGSDYTATSGRLVFAPGQTTQTITVSVTGDRRIEPAETFFVKLSSPLNATISDTSGLGMILNDD